MPDELELAPNLTDEDRALIRLLQADGRRSFARLAADLGRPESTVRRRFLELQRGGVVKITTVAAPELLGYSVTAMVAIKLHGHASPSQVAREIAATPYAFYVMAVCGEFNVLAEITCRDLDHLQQTVERDVFGVDGVASVEVFPYYTLLYQDPSFDPPDGRRDGAPARPIRFDATDQSIVSILSADGRTPYSEIAARLRISESQVRQRLRRMLASGALRVMALTNPRGMGFEVAALVAIRLAPGFEARAVAAQLAALPAVIYAVICAGRYDVFVEVVCRHMQDLLDTVDVHVRQMPGIATAEPWVYLQLHYRPVTPDRSGTASPYPGNGRELAARTAPAGVTL